MRITPCIVLVLSLLIPAPSSALHNFKDFKGEGQHTAVAQQRTAVFKSPRASGRTGKQPQSIKKAQVIRVINGDTIIVDIDGIHEKVRLIGIDAPEPNDPNRRRVYFAMESAQYTDRHLLNIIVSLDFDPANSPKGHRDRRGRLLAYVYVGDELFNLRIIRDGYARAYTKYPFALMEEFRQAEREAQRAERGLWSSVTAPSDRMVYITSTGTKYHRDGCRLLNKSKVEANIERVLDLGYEPCKVCKP